ncbi:ubiquinone biosynthesis O-methyltransferase [mine drainage metagenome]|uniref:Ubiquinone biosynthesis O-methyltransferase n=1 Tax=mine drainage metagenome TaxID=410659 RepID=A0A1J5T5B4_9ZZZZ
MMGRELHGASFPLALRKHLDGDLAAAEAIYRQLIHDAVDEAQARHYLGFLLQQSGRLQEAVEQLTAAIVLDDSHAEWHFNLGIALLRQGLAAASIEALNHAIAIDPGKYFYWTNLGAAFEANQEHARAEQCYRVAMDLDPDSPDAYYLLAALCLQQQRFDEARHFNHRGIVAAPADSTSKLMRGQAYYELGRTDDAIALFEDWLRNEPHNAVAAHLLAAYRGRQVPHQCSSEYVEQTFDAFAKTFENVLGRLKYSGPRLVQEHLAALDIPAAGLRVLDLGCGTGLVGEVLQPHARELVGVDLSRAMLDQAAAKHLYRQLHRSGIVEFLRASHDRYDLVACMDTLTYFGKLEEVFTLIRRNLEPGGLLLFSTEKLSGAYECDYRLNVSGRYSHHQDYLAAVLDAAGFAIGKMADVAIRNESGCPIEGQFVCASRRA